jgi:hypothetical protein
MNIRTFIQNLSLRVSLRTADDPLIKILSKHLDITAEEYEKGFDHICDFTRSEDLLHLRFYFVNASLKRGKIVRKPHFSKANNASKRKRLLKKYKFDGTDLYMLVRIPQQHITESYVNTDQFNDGNKQSALLSGYSYLTFRLKEEEEFIYYSSNGLLKWDKFDLITLNDLPDYQTISSSKIRGEVETRLSDNTHQKFFFDAGITRLPVTLFEVPYQLFLTPTNRILPRSRGDYHEGYIFEHNNVPICYFSNQKGTETITLSQAWENKLIYHIKGKNASISLSPNFKAVAFGLRDGELPLLPSPLQRIKIVEHSLAEFKDESRDIMSKEFKIGAFGVTSNSCYKNMSPLNNSSFFAYKHRIKNGRDNYVEILEVGVDIRSGKKVLVAEIGQRVHHKGNSKWVKRNYLTFLQNNKKYGNVDFPYTESVTTEEGFFFKPVQIKDGVPNHCVVKTGIPKDSKGNFLPFIPMWEDATLDSKLKDAKDKIYHNEFIRTDHSGNNTVTTRSHMYVVFKAQFDEGTANRYMGYHDTLASHPDLKNILKEQILSEKIAFIEPLENSVTNKNHGTSLTTEYFQFRSIQAHPFHHENPVQQHMVYASVIPPQAESLPNAEASLFRYSDTYNAKGILGQKERLLNVEKKELKNKIETFQQEEPNTYFNFSDKNGNEVSVINSSKKAIAIKRLGEITNELHQIPREIKSALQTFEENRVFLSGVIDAIENDFQNHTLREVSGKFNDSLDDLGNLINSDITYGGISQLEQGIILLDDTKVRVVEARNNLTNGLEDIKTLRPEDVLRGLNTEILNGISLKDILKEVIPIDQTPVFEVLKKADEGFRLFIEFKKQYEDLKQELKELPEQIRKEAKKQLNIEKSKLENYIKKRLEKEKELLILKLEQIIVTPVQKKVDNYTEVVNFFLRQNAPTANDIISRINIDIRKKKKVEILKAFKERIIQDGNGEVIEEFIRVSLQVDRADELKQIRGYAELAVKEFVAGKKKEIEEGVQRELDILNAQIDTKIFEFIDGNIDTIIEINQAIEYLRFIRDTVEEFEELGSEKGFIKNEILKILSLITGVNPEDEFKKIKVKLTKWALPFKDSYDELIKSYIEEENEILNKYATAYGEFNKASQQIEEKKLEIQRKVAKLKSDLKQAESDLKNFAQIQLKRLENQVKHDNAELIARIEDGDRNLKGLKARLALGRKQIRKILESNQQSLRYKWNVQAEQFKPIRSSFISFIPGPSGELNIDVKTDVNYELSLDKPPQYKGVEVYSYNEIKDFRLTFFDVISADIDNITFETGTRIDTDLDVNIRNIEFTGALSFVNVFQSFLDVLKFLKKLADNVIIVSYDLRLPDITTGAFNFVGGKLYAELAVPIGGHLPVQITFGVNRPGDLFLMSYGIFGGRGCFQIVMNTQYGVVGVTLILEFGGVVLLKLGVAKGMAYLFAGIYYRKLNDTVVIKGYLTAGGHLSIAGLVTASITFVMTLKGNGHYMLGSCSVKYTVKLGPFFEKSFSIRMDKRIKGTDTKPSNKGKLNTRFAEFSAAKKNLESAQYLETLTPKEKLELEYYNGSMIKSGPVLFATDAEWSKYLTQFDTI